MLRLLFTVDDWIIERLFQPVCDRLAGWTTPQGIGSFFLTGAILAALAAAAAAVIEQRYAVTMPILFLASLWSFRLYGAHWDNAETGAFPRARITEFVARWLYIPWGTFVLLDQVTSPSTHLDQWIFLGGWWLVAAALFFLACRRNPPKRRETRAWSTWLRWRPA